jgi:hypothetical protein
MRVVAVEGVTSGGGGWRGIEGHCGAMVSATRLGAKTADVFVEAQERK